MADTIILHAKTPADVERARRALDDARIPYRTDLLIAEPPRVVFTVPRARLADARDVLDLPEGGEVTGVGLETAEYRFPWAELRILVAVVVLHLALVFWLRGPFEQGYELFRQGALLKGGTAQQPWRLITSLMLHSGVSHALWNGVSMTVFGLPLLVNLGRKWTALIYLSAGIGGSFTALVFAEAGTRIVGSSGAVAGLFGAWVVLTMTRARLEDLAGRARIRALGVALLFLPSLLSPVSSTGSPISVSSHLGGLFTGMAIGMLISRGLLARWVEAIRESRRI